MFLNLAVKKKAGHIELSIEKKKQAIAQHSLQCIHKANEKKY